MTIEDRVKDMILEEYHSVREFCITHGIPYTTVKSMLQRGFNNSSVSNVLKICSALRISADAVAQGRIEPVKDIETPTTDLEVLIDNLVIFMERNKVTMSGKEISDKRLKNYMDYLKLGLGMLEDE